ncbi:hypothetical protein [Maridesulfovibrio ferrireducens]|uniref:bacteriophage T4 gp5 trimerisation domain-containing protein n=1 Tax=Maridesulfovibrio ferrireducens TaxID=246191 RepID=UPI001A17F8CA|nr:hypothetical protein [Maridesulfovibrio ferrireducens]MBI9109920.1 hypothetical protein [Maridesulfovibrio ferrireducens]
MLKLFPELSGGLHLDRYARVLAVADEPEQGGSCERFRPRYAVDLEILTPEGERDAAYPIYKDVPLPVASAGMERGVYGFPETGTLVVIGFAYGRPDHPLIKQIYPLGLSLPKVATGELLWQQDADTLQRVDPNGNWTRKTTGQITDRSLKRVVEAVDSMVELVRDFRKVAGNSTEEIGGVKHIEALGAVLLGSGGHIDMVAVDNLNFVTAKDCSWIISQHWNGVTGGNHHHTVKLNMTENVLMNRNENTTLNLTETVGENHSLTVQKDLTEAVILNRTETVGKDHTSTVNENRIETVLKDRTATINGNKTDIVKEDFSRTVQQNFTSQTDGNYTELITGNQDSTVEGQSNETVTGDKQLEAENVRIKGTTITLMTKDGTISFFPLMLDFMQEVRDALNVLAVHTHPEATKIVEGPEVQSHADDIGVIRGKLDVLSG